MSRSEASEWGLRMLASGVPLTLLLDLAEQQGPDSLAILLTDGLPMGRYGLTPEQGETDAGEAIA
jgi:hypothetical protein